MRNKYNAQRTEIAGHVFASKREAARFLELQLLLRTGEIRDLRLQPSYPLHGRKGPLVYPSGRRAIYRADFEYITADGAAVTEDVKGVMTDAFKLKWAILNDMGLPVTIVK